MTASQLPYREINLSRGLVAIVDLEDYERLSKFTWYAKVFRGKQTYAARNRRISPGRTAGTRATRMMHREVLGLDYADKSFVDHINHNTLDNRKENLRVCTNQQNCFNMKVRPTLTGFKGVYKNKKRFQASLRVNGKRVNGGNFITAEEAARAYDNLARRFHGEFACTNFPAEAHQ